jgi:hypothetical protein
MAATEVIRLRFCTQAASGVHSSSLKPVVCHLESVSISEAVCVPIANTGSEDGGLSGETAERTLVVSWFLSFLPARRLF